MNIPISGITHLPEVDVRQYTHQETAERYAEILDELPPVALTKLPDGRLVLTDGRHRVAAALMLNREEIAAEVTDGSLQDAVVAAATANAKHGLPFTPDEQRRAALRLWESDNGKTNKRKWTAKTVAAAVGSSERRVTHWVRAAQVETSTGAGNSLSTSHLEEFASAPADVRPQLVEAAAEGGWSSRQVRDVVREVREAEAPINLGALITQANREARNDPLANLYAVLKYANLVKTEATPEMLAELDAEESQRIYNGIEAALATLRTIQAWTTEAVA